MNIIDINMLIDDVNNTCDLINSETKKVKNKTYNLRSDKWKQISKELKDIRTVVKRIRKEYAMPISGSGLEATYILFMPTWTNDCLIILVKNGNVSKWDYLECINNYVEKEYYYNYEWMNKLIDWWFDKRDCDLYEKRFIDYVNKELVNKIKIADNKLREATEEYEMQNK